MHELEKTVLQEMGQVSVHKIIIPAFQLFDWIHSIEKSITLIDVFRSFSAWNETLVENHWIKSILLNNNVRIIHCYR